MEQGFKWRQVCDDDDDDDDDDDLLLFRLYLFYTVCSLLC